MKRIIFAILTLLFLSSCTVSHIRTYNGNAKNINEIALLVNDQNGMTSFFSGLTGGLSRDGDVRLIKINGEEGPGGEKFGYHGRSDGKLLVELLPGEHVLEFIFLGQKWATSLRSIKPLSIKVNVQAGERYKITTRVKENRWTPVITRESDNIIIFEGFTQ